MDDDALKELLLKENEDFKRTFEQHKLCDGELEKLLKKKFPTETEMLRIRELKKEKLFHKDKLFHILADFKRSRGPGG